jgi:hypothetical protein
MLRTRNCQLPTKAIARLAPYCAAALISVLALTQTLPVYSTEVPAAGTSNVNNCNASNSDFGADLKRLSDTLEEPADIPPEFLQKYFAGCTIEKIQEFLAKNGFTTGDSAPAFGDREAGITRTVIAARMMQDLGQLVSSHCRIILQTKSSNALDVHGFFYLDGP